MINRSLCFQLRRKDFKIITNHNNKNILRKVLSCTFSTLIAVKYCYDKLHIQIEGETIHLLSQCHLSETVELPSLLTFLVWAAGITMRGTGCAAAMALRLPPAEVDQTSESSNCQGWEAKCCWANEVPEYCLLQTQTWLL